MKFGQQLEERAHAPWKAQYIDYNQLKATLKKIREAAGEEEVNAAKREFQAQLDDQLLKILGFFHVKERELRWRMRQLKTSQAGSTSATAWLELARDTVLLLEFLHLNYQGIRKIHKKYFKEFEPLRPQEAADKGGLVLQFKRPPGDKEAPHEHVSFLPSDLAEDLRDMQEHATLRGLVRELRQKLSEIRQCIPVGSRGPNLDKDVESGEGTSLVTANEESKALIEDPLVADLNSVVAPDGNWTNPRRALAIIDGIKQKLERAEQSADEGASLVTTATFVGAQAGIFTRVKPEVEETRTILVGLALNLFSTFAFMANYTLVIPSTHTFAKRLGLPASWAGIFVGAADITMIASATMHSWWTNKAFKAPLIVGALCCAFGNTLYSLAYDTNSLFFLLFGRLLIGFGGTRAVSRRFIADFIGSKARTSASVSFVVASTLGMATGPFTAWPLSKLPERTVPLLNVAFNKLTAPGYLMSVLWASFFLVALLTMYEPRKLEQSPLRKPLLGEGNADNDARHREEKGKSDEEGQTDDEDDDEENDEEERHEEENQDKNRIDHRREHFRGWVGQGSATAACLFAVFALKAVQEAACTVTPLLMGGYYSWGSGSAGILLGVLLVSTLPVNFAAGALAKHIGERSLMMVANLALLLSSLAIVHPPRRVPSLMTIIAALTTNLVGTTVLEGVAYSILSKRMPPALRHGVLNAGFLATCGGTTGRFIGNLFVSFFNIWGTDTLRGLGLYTDLLFASCALLALSTTAASLATWHHLFSP